MTARRPLPLRWKSFILTFVIVFPTVQIVNRILLPWIDVWVLAWPPLTRDLLSVGVMCMVLNRALPASQRVLASWLEPDGGQG